MKQQFLQYLAILLIACLGCSCQKYLDQKPDKKLVVPATLQDLQAILDNTTVMNATYPYAGEIAADNYYLTTADWQARSLTEHNAYIWDRDVFNDLERNDWSLSYIIVYNANVVLDELAKDSYNSYPQTDRDNIKGEALFFRSYAFYQLLQEFAAPYDAASAPTTPGIALRLSSDLNIPTTRASVQACYDQVISDLQQASSLLFTTQAFKTRPSAIAANALLSRVYLCMGRYSDALNSSLQALQQYNTLLDYNSLNSNAAQPFPLFNAETIFHSVMTTTITLSVAAKIDTLLYRSYALTDLRRSLFFKTNTDGSIAFKGSYDGSLRLFNGLATDELYLTAAECYARAGDNTNAILYLNNLLVKRYKSGLYIPYTTSTVSDVLGLILTERRKELLLRGLRWTDLRRLNREGTYTTTLTRNINGQAYTLPPNDNRYTFWIPQVIINLTGIQQNPM